MEVIQYININLTQSLQVVNGRKEDKAVEVTEIM